MDALKHESGDSNSPSTPSQSLAARPAGAMSNMQCAMTPGDERYYHRVDFEPMAGGSSAQIQALDRTQPILPLRQGIPAQQNPQDRNALPGAGRRFLGTGNYPPNARHARSGKLLERGRAENGRCIWKRAWPAAGTP
jgi:hypothetical protein